MIICSTSNVDLIHGVIGYGNVSDGTTDQRITNTKTAVVGQTGIFNILNSTSVTPNFTIIETINIGIGTTPLTGTNILQVQGNTFVSGLITANAGITVPSGQTLTANIINSSGLITANAGITVPSGQTLTSYGALTANTITASGSIGIGIANPAVKLQVLGGDIACSGDIISYYSDERLKTKLSNIKDPLKIINELNGFYYIPNDLARIHGITNTRTEVSLSAQDVQKVLPEIVKIAPFDLAKDENDNNVSKSGENYLTLSYDRLAPIFVEAIKELSMANKELNEKYNRLLETISNNK